MGTAFQQVPSFKFLPLVYQVASRLSAGECTQASRQYDWQAAAVVLQTCHASCPAFGRLER